MNVGMVRKDQTHHKQTITTTTIKKKALGPNKENIQSCISLSSQCYKGLSSSAFGLAGYSPHGLFPELALYCS